MGLSLFLTACQTPKKIVLVFGDSLVYESEPYIRFQFGNDYDVRIASYGGTALCDYSEMIVNDTNSLRPAATVIAFTGNAITQCMSGTRTEEQIAVKYRNDLTDVLNQVAGSRVPIGVLTAPPSLAATGGEIISPPVWSVGQLPTGVRQRTQVFNNEIVAAVQAAQTRNVPVVLVDGYTPFSAPSTGGWTKVLPCLPLEQGSPSCRNGLIDVRSADLVHLCPVRDQLPCPVWSSGEWRWAGLITNHVKERLSGMRGFLDDVRPVTNGIALNGWGFDFDAPVAATDIHVYANNQFIGSIAANQSRPDVGGVFPMAGANHGFSQTLSVRPGAYNVCAFVINQWGADRDQHLPIGCRNVTVAVADPFGFLDDVTAIAGGVRVSGWSIDRDEPLSPVTIRLYANFVLVGTSVASTSRPDVGNVFPGTGTSHGFSFQTSAPTGDVNVCAVAVNIGFGRDVIIGCKRVTIPPAVTPPSSSSTTSSTASSTTSSTTSSTSSSTTSSTSSIVPSG